MSTLFESDVNILFRGESKGHYGASLISLDFKDRKAALEQLYQHIELVLKKCQSLNEHDEDVVCFKIGSSKLVSRKQPYAPARTPAHTLDLSVWTSESMGRRWSVYQAAENWSYLIILCCIDQSSLPSTETGDHQLFARKMERFVDQLCRERQPLLQKADLGGGGRAGNIGDATYLYVAVKLGPRNVQSEQISAYEAARLGCRKVQVQEPVCSDCKSKKSILWRCKSKKSILWPCYNSWELLEYWYESPKKTEEKTLCEICFLVNFCNISAPLLEDIDPSLSKW